MNDEPVQTPSAASAAAPSAAPLSSACWDILRPGFWKAGSLRKQGWEPVGTLPAGVTLPPAPFMRTTLKRRPERLAEVGVKAVEGRWIQRVRWDIGISPTGPANFIGLHLKARDARPEEWLILTVRNGGEWLLADGQRVAEPPGTVSKRRPLIHEVADEFNPRFSEAWIQTFFHKEKYGRISINHDNKVNYLEFPETVSRLAPMLDGSVRPHLGADEAFIDTWALSRHAFVIVD